GRIADAEGRADEALDTYGEVIAADIRPTRAEAVYRTLLLLDRRGSLDMGKAIPTLAAQAILWRGDKLEADMLAFLADLYFRHGDFREGFATVREAAAYHPEGPSVDAMMEQAQTKFSDLYLNGLADVLSPVDAL